MTDGARTELDSFSAASRAIIKAVGDADPAALAAALEASPNDVAVRHSFREGFRGTLLYRTLDKSVLYANSRMVSLVDDNLDCAHLLRAAGAPAHSANPHPGDIAAIFLDTDWSTTGASATLARTFGELIDADLVDLDQCLPHNSKVGGMTPLLAACKVGNTAALQVMLQKGARLPPPAAGQDVLQHVGTIVEANRPAILALLTERLMRDRLDGAPTPASTPSRRRAPGA